MEGLQGHSSGARVVEDFLIEDSTSFRQEDFVMKYENYSKNKVGQREYLNGPATSDLTHNLYSLFESTVEVNRIRRALTPNH